MEEYDPERDIDMGYGVCVGVRECVCGYVCVWRWRGEGGQLRGVE